jgi:hypothetical protein
MCLMSTDAHQPVRRGRPPKPGRRRINAYLPGTLATLLREDAEAAGMTQTDKLAEILASFYRTLDTRRSK